MKVNKTHGTLEQFIKQVETRIEQLGGEVNATSTIQADQHDKLTSERYIHSLIGDIQSRLGKVGKDSTFDTDTTDDALFVFILNDNDVTEFTVPFEDLSFDLDKLDSDSKYVADTILDAIRSKHPVIESATNTASIPAKPCVGVSSSDDLDIPELNIPEYDDEYEDSDYTFVATKQVRDCDGFLTDYTWYKTPDGRHVFVFGDRELYRPEDGYFDMECDSESVARDWFDNFDGCDEDGDSLYVNDDPEDEFGHW